MEPAAQVIVVSFIVGIIGKLIDKYLEKSKRFPKYKGYLKLKR